MNGWMDQYPCVALNDAGSVSMDFTSTATSTCVVFYLNRLKYYKYMLKRRYELGTQQSDKETWGQVWRSNQWLDTDSSLCVGFCACLGLIEFVAAAIFLSAEFPSFRYPQNETEGVRDRKKVREQKEGVSLQNKHDVFLEIYNLSEILNGGSYWW